MKFFRDYYDYIFKDLFFVSTPKGMFKYWNLNPNLFLFVPQPGIEPESKV